jgi:hypothetical protein
MVLTKAKCDAMIHHTLKYGAVISFGERHAICPNRRNEVSLGLAKSESILPEA